MLIVTMQNITPPPKLAKSETDCKYRAVVYVNKTIIYIGEVDHHDRAAGWEDLVIKLAVQSKASKVKQ